MKLEIDFDNKVITIKDQTTLGELVEKLKSLNLKDWKDYKINESVLTWSTPWTIFPTYPVYPAYPLAPTYEPYVVTCGATSIIN